MTILSDSFLRLILVSFPNLGIIEKEIKEVLTLNFYITSGTYEFLTKVKAKDPTEKMLLLGVEDEAILLHETNGASVFNQPRKYEVVNSVGTNLDKTGYAVMNNIPVTDEGRPLFEYRFKNRQGKIEHQPGFVAIRVLRPLASNTYVILTLWEDQKAFTAWKESTAFQNAHNKPEGKTSTQPPNIFSGPSYVTTYSIAEEE